MILRIIYFSSKFSDNICKITDFLGKIQLSKICQSNLEFLEGNEANIQMTLMHVEWLISIEKISFRLEGENQIFLIK